MVRVRARRGRWRGCDRGLGGRRRRGRGLPRRTARCRSRGRGVRLGCGRLLGLGGSGRLAVGLGAQARELLFELGPLGRELLDHGGLGGPAGLELLTLLREVDRRGFEVVDRLLALRVGAVEQFGAPARVERIRGVEHGTEVGAGTLVDLQGAGAGDDGGAVGVIFRDRDLLLELGDLTVEVLGVLLALEPLIGDLVDRRARLRDLVAGALRVRAHRQGNERDDHRDHEDASSRQHGVLAALRHTGTGTAPKAESACTGAAH